MSIGAHIEGKSFRSWRDGGVSCWILEEKKKHKHQMISDGSALKIT
jgi:hypothetical protein